MPSAWYKELLLDGSGSFAYHVTLNDAPHTALPCAPVGRLSPDTVTVPDTGVGLLAIRAYIILADAPAAPAPPVGPVAPAPPVGPVAPLVPAYPETTMLALVQLNAVLVAVATSVTVTVAV